MGKYDPLTAYLNRQRCPDVTLSFRDIERIVGRILPKAALQPRWWSDAESDTVSPQKRAWDAASFTPTLDLKAETVRFTRRV